jgi:PAS domain S-box-containing protein
MKEFLEKLFSSDFMPHGYCYLWNPGLVWLHVVSDALIALAYFSIPATLIYFIRKRRDLPFNWMFVSFGIFILACGATHAMEVWTLWHGTYWLSGAIKAITAMASVPTAILLVQLVPRALAPPSPEAIKLEIAERKRAEQALHQAKNELELKILERTAELRKANEDLVAEIVQHTQALETLREREARISLAAESADLAFWVLYPEQNTVWMSEKGRAMYGFTLQEPLTRESLVSRIHPDERVAVQAAFEQARASQETFEIEHRIVLPDGKTRWVIVRGRCLWDEDGNVLEIICVTIDLSAQSQSDLQLQVQREELARLSRIALMGEMTASLGHELNQPLTAIANNAAAGRRFFDRGQIDPAILKQLLADIAAASHRAGEIINGIRGMARKGKSARSLLNLNGVIGDTIRLVRSDILIRETTVVADFDSRLPDVEADLVQIQQVLLNLIMNALDAVSALPPAQRRIIISTRREEGPCAEVSVRDFGAGLPTDGPEKVFDHFFSTKAEGMGMGLTIARSIVEAHAGTLGAEDAEGGGARFFFRLPAAQGSLISKAA